MKNKILCATLALLPSVNVFAEASHNFVFICHKGMQYDNNMVRKAFGGNLDEPHPVDNKTLQVQFLEYMGVTLDQYTKRWDTRFFRRALNRPYKKENDAAVAEYVASHPEGIGYVSTNPNNPDIEVCGL